MLVIFYQLMILRDLTHGAPILPIELEISQAAGNRTALNTKIAPAWASTSGVQGTSDILWSCLLTLIACVYTALHLNVPPPHEGKWQHLWRKMRWVALALFAPEIVLYCACTQFWKARQLIHELNSIRHGKDWTSRDGTSYKEHMRDLGNLVISRWRRNSDASKPTTCPKEKFKIKYGYFIVMGGFAVDISKICNGTELRTLTPKGLLYLARDGYTNHLDITLDAISNKSKADLISKSLVCMQVLWFIIQCIARKRAGYPVVLLEVHTTVHVVCALIMDILWWEKPQDVSGPIVLDIQSHLDAIALWVTVRDEGFNCEIDRLEIFSDESMQNSVSLNQQASPLCMQTTTKEPFTISPESHRIRVIHEGATVSHPYNEDTGSVCALSADQALPCGIGPIVGENFPRDTLKPLNIRYLSARDVLRWDLLAKRIRRHPKYIEWLEDSTRPKFIIGCDCGKSSNLTAEHATEAATNSTYSRRDCPKGWELSRSNLRFGKEWGCLVSHSDNFPYNFNFDMGYYRFRISVEEMLKNDLMIFFLLLLPLAYGGIHLTAWSFEFASRTELLLWKIACIDIMGTFFVFLIVLNKSFSLDWYFWRRRYEPPNPLDEGWPYIFKFFVISSTIMLIIYVLSRIYIVVEAFTSLRHVPIGAYASIPWLQAIPHV